MSQRLPRGGEPKGSPGAGSRAGAGRNGGKACDGPPEYEGFFPHRSGEGPPGEEKRKTPVDRGQRRFLPGAGESPAIWEK